MTTEKNNPKPGAGPKPRTQPKSRASAKPHAVIEGSAEDVTPKAAKSKKGATAKTPKTTPEAPKAPDVKGAAKAEVKTPDADKAKPGPRPASAGWGKAKSAAPLFVAGLAGSMATLAIIALAAAFDAPPRAWLARITGAEDAAGLAREASVLAQATAAKIETSLTSQQTALDGLKAGLAAVEDKIGPLEGLPETVREINATLEKATLDRLGELPAQTTALALRIGAVETRLDTVVSSAEARAQTVDSLASALDQAAKAGTSAATVSAGLARTISRLDDTEARLVKLALDIKTMANAAPPDDSWRRAAETQLAALRRDVDALGARLAAEEAAARANQLEADLNALGSAIAAGRPYGELLSPFGDSPALATLAKYAATGAPGIESLKVSLAELPVQAPSQREETEGALGRIVGILGGAIKVRRTDRDDTPQNPLTAARKALDAGAVARAADIISQTKQGPETVAWVKAARARAQIDAALAELEASPALRSSRIGD